MAGPESRERPGNGTEGNTGVLGEPRIKGASYRSCLIHPMTLKLKAAAAIRTESHRHFANAEILETSRAD